MTSNRAWYRQPSFWIGLLISALSLFLLSLLVNVPDLIEKLKQTDLHFVIIGLLVTCVSACLRAIRWASLLGPGIGFWNVFHAENIGNMLNSVLPLRAGDPARAYILSRAKNGRGIPALEALSTIVLIRLVDVFAVGILLGLVIPALEVPEIVKAGGYSILAVALLAFVVLVIGAFARQWLLRLIAAILTRFLSKNLADRLLAWIDSFLIGLSALRNVRSLLSLVGTTTLLWISYVAFYVLILRAFSPTPVLAWAALAACAASFSLAVPSSPGAIGVFHAAVAFVMAPYLTADTATAYAIVVHATEIASILTFGAYSLAATGSSIQRVTAQITRQPDAG